MSKQLYRISGGDDASPNQLVVRHVSSETAKLVLQLDGSALMHVPDSSDVAIGADYIGLALFWKSLRQEARDKMYRAYRLPFLQDLTSVDGKPNEHAQESADYWRERAADLETQLGVLRDPRRKAPGQHSKETPMEYLRRVVHSCNLEQESLLDAMPCVEAALEYFGLWSIYHTDFMEGIEEAIESGEDPKPLVDFVAKWSLDWDLSWIPKKGVKA
jgi:hypothetical protein